MADTIREARRLAKLVWPKFQLHIQKGRGVCTHIEARQDRERMSVGFDIPPSVSIYAPTRRAALAGLCGALRAMVKEA